MDKIRKTTEVPNQWAYKKFDQNVTYLNTYEQGKMGLLEHETEAQYQCSVPIFYFYFLMKHRDMMSTIHSLCLSIICCYNIV